MSGKRSVLVVDDEKLNRMILCEVFKGEIDTIEAENGEEAIQVLEKHSDQIGAILLDVIMPVKSGFEVLEFMRKKHLDTEIPVIIITSDDSYEMQKKMDEYKISDLINKPFIPKIIYRRTNNVMRLYSSKRDQVAGLQEELEALQQENAELKDRVKKYEKTLKKIEKQMTVI